MRKFGRREGDLEAGGQRDRAERAVRRQQRRRRSRRARRSGGPRRCRRRARGRAGRRRRRRCSDAQEVGSGRRAVRRWRAGWSWTRPGRARSCGVFRQDAAPRRTAGAAAPAAGRTRRAIGGADPAVEVDARSRGRRRAPRGRRRPARRPRRCAAGVASGASSAAGVHLDRGEARLDLRGGRLGELARARRRRPRRRPGPVSRTGPPSRAWTGTP